MTSSRPLLIVGHGTRDEAGVAGFVELVELVAKRAPERDVRGGFIELSRPVLRDATAELAGLGNLSFDAVPLVLVAAGHAKGDIPAALAREQERHPGMTYRYGRPLGPHPTLLDLLDRRLNEVLTEDERADTTVVLVGRGSSDPDANAEHFKVARLMDEGRGLGGVEGAFISLAEPSVRNGLERARRLGAQRIVVLPYFLFAGILPTRVSDQTLAWAAEHPELDVRIAGVIGASDALADLVLERAHEARHGDIRMNCDTCLYRIAMPGHEHQVGAEQHPHDHPDDPSHPHGHDHGNDHGHSHPHA
jgi:sirohydrochlorin cobaltochelatase